MNEIIINENEVKKFDFDFNKYKAIIYSFLFYTLGLVLGSYFYKITSGKAIENLVKPKEHSLIYLFSSNVCVYFALFFVVAFLGFCLIGYPFTNIVPMLLGIETGLKCGYFLINYSIKGLGYILIMIVPFIALFLTILSFTIKLSTDLSKSLIEIAKNNTNSNSLDVKPYLKKYLLLGLSIIVTAFADAGITTILFSIVSL